MIKCLICMGVGDAAKSDEFVAIQCGHCFHKNCLEVWLQTSHTCPACRLPTESNRLIKLHVEFEYNHCEGCRIVQSEVLDKVSTIDLLEIECSNLRETVSVQRNNISELCNECSELKRENACQEDQIVDLIHKCIDCKNEDLLNKDRIKELENVISLHKEKEKKCEEECWDYKIEILQCKGKIAKFARKYSRLKNEASLQKKKISSLEEECNDFRSQISFSVLGENSDSSTARQTICEDLDEQIVLEHQGLSTTPTNRSPPSEPTETTQQTNYNSNGPALDFNAELTKHLTLKKQKKQQQEQSANATEANLRTNRGPPPQPPAQKQYPVDSAPKGKSSPPAVPPPPITQQQHSNESNSSALFKKQTNSHSTSLSPTTNGISLNSNTVVAPNKSSLFSNMSQTTTTNDRESNSSISSLNSNSNSTKPVPNHGKPNCAPKPPGIQQIIAAKGGNNGSTNGSNGTGRPTVARHHSMKSPRSPPVTTSGGPVFPTTQHFGTMRGAPQQFQSQDSINRPAPTAPIGRPTVAPPRPPNIKPPPPPTPIRSISNTNLTNLPLSLPPNAVNSNSNFGSATNVSSNASTLKKQMKHQVGSSSVNDVSSMHNTANSISNNNLGMQSEKSAPPLPPHRTCPAPPPPVRQNSNSLTAPAPVPPQRHSSIRTSSVSHQTVTMQSPTVTATVTTTKQVNRLIIDLEKKFSQNFHNVTEFRPPGPFTNLPKSYPSRNVKSVNG
ncbi:WAS/WASL-interacting protein family member 2 isoform X2 [Bradysia coprophila]|uniref:WAS/WASL-interacting protein family member 2 isoform X2 n=1 Tax=Bradysia coprophila TaxID=38358 RepID=UPI00187DD405|nr:WAS/WASL-interacting protein family member 2 isoform X2 [Bradysia coprophila]